jgi:molybdopterin synthase catalytic subunit
MNNYLITAEPIDLGSLITHVSHPNAGAICTFIGTVREMTKGKKTMYLEYQSYIPMAEKKLAQIGEEITAEHPEAKVAIIHRIGKLEISDVAVAIAISSPHRDASFKACRYAIERIKEIVPIWKKENWEDGDSWIGDQKEQVAYPSGKPILEGEQE